MDNNIDEKVKDIAVKLRKIREMKGLTREKFCEPLGLNAEYWGLIERGEQSISLMKLLLVCEKYDIAIESLVSFHNETSDAIQLRKEITVLLEYCQPRQLEFIKKYIEDIGMII